MYSVNEVNNILYNNRSSKLIQNFLPSLDPLKVIEQEKRHTFSKKLFMDIDDPIEFKPYEINLEQPDIIYTPQDLEKLDYIFNHLDKNTIEYKYLLNRGLTDDMIHKYKFGSMSSITDKKILDILGCSVHPILSKILGDGIKGGGVLIPLFENDVLKNVAVRRLNSDNKLKYNLSVPDIHLWGYNEVNWDEPIWITEGLFDRIFMIEHGMNNVISASTPGLSIIHLMKILQKNPVGINYWSDRDNTGLKHGGIIQKFFSLNNIHCEIYISEEEKDPFDHFKNGLTKEDIYPVKITKEYINSFPKNKNENFLEYLKNREF
jgi:hypothetical protein